MLYIKKTDENGSVHEMTFSRTSEAAEALRALFDIEKSEAQKRSEARRELNDNLRQAWRSTSTTDPSKLFNQREP